jgi:hypothetical protein
MPDDRRLDTKLSDLAKELRARPLVSGFPISDAFTVRGFDEAGKPGLFAAVLLSAQSEPELDTLTMFRDVLTRKLKQLDTTMPAWPIVVQGAPEVIDGVATVPGGSEYFAQLKGELTSRAERFKALQARKASIETPMVMFTPTQPTLMATAKKTKPAATATAPTKGQKVAKPTSAARTARRP